jgi:uncharacterized protein
MFPLAGPNLGHAGATQVVLGEGASVVLEGQKVVPTETLKTGFKFTYPDIDLAVANIVAA